MPLAPVHFWPNRSSHLHMYHLHSPVGMLWIEPSKTPPDRWMLCFAPPDGSPVRSSPYQTIRGAASAVYERRTGFAEWDRYPRAAGEPNGINGWTKGVPATAPQGQR